MSLCRVLQWQCILSLLFSFSFFLLETGRRDLQQASVYFMSSSKSSFAIIFARPSSAHQD